MNNLQKNLNLDFSNDVLKIIKCFNINDVKLTGSMNNKIILFPNDYDCYDIIKKSFTPLSFKNKIQSVIKKLLKINNTYIGDIKFGVLENGSSIRWKVSEILKGFKIIDNKKYWLSSCLNDKSMKKIDVVHLVNNSIYKDFSCVYLLHNEMKDEAYESLKKDIYEYQREKNYFKMLKRIYSLISYKNDKICHILVDFFNSSVGQLNNIMSDINTIDYLLENQFKIPIKRLNNEIDNFKNRFSTIIINSFLKKQKKIIKLINKIIDEGYKINDLKLLFKILNVILQKETFKFLNNKSYFKNKTLSNELFNNL